ncbi:MAG: cellulase family glycosylhydrolase, partial [Planctomycetes bacterium]|nr:cellulase family glycosylhydrolase [Planctomycetota bacterium]
MAAAALVLCGCAGTERIESPWPEEKAMDWYARTGWLVGCNFGPSTAINQLEMWQKESFDLETIDRELGWAESIGFNSVRVFLHDLLWKADREGFLDRMDQFLTVADKHGIGVMFVLLDGVWDPHPELGKQRDPKPHVHNSGWVQSPGVEIISDPARHIELKPYIQGVVRRFRTDERIHAWDIFNEPDNPNASSYGEQETPRKAEMALLLLRSAFAWVREVNPSQPITAGVWSGDWSSPEKLSPINRLMLDESDIITYHCYGNLDAMKALLEPLKRYGRPILCTEYMSRPSGSTFQVILPYLKAEKVGAYNWGFV